MKTASEFLEAFEAIPADKWCTGSFTKGDSHCALGWADELGGQAAFHELNNLFKWTLGVSPSVVNDEFSHWAGKGTTPKERVCNALREIVRVKGGVK